jgi:transcriptional regulator with XRE-family HTH domain
MTNKQTSLVDDYVGVRIRERRRDLGLSSAEFAEKIGVSYQQLNKYERAVDRVTAGRLYEIARAMNTPIDYFYEGFSEQESRRVAARQGSRKQIEMARHLDGIYDERHLEAISQVVRVLAGR